MHIVVDTSLCDEPPYREVKGELRGLYSAGFEESKFMVCADTALGIPARPTRPRDVETWSDITAWVSFMDPAVADQYRQAFMAAAQSARASDQQSVGSTYVRWVGVLRGPGKFGHLGVSNYGFMVDKVIYVGLGDGHACREPPDGRR